MIENGNWWVCKYNGVEIFAVKKLPEWAPRLNSCEWTELVSKSSVVKLEKELEDLRNKYLLAKAQLELMQAHGSGRVYGKI